MELLILVDQFGKPKQILNDKIKPSFSTFYHDIFAILARMFRK